MLEGPLADSRAQVHALERRNAALEDELRDQQQRVRRERRADWPAAACVRPHGRVLRPAANGDHWTAQVLLCLG